MRPTLLSLLLLTAPLVAQPTQSDRYQLAPLVSTAKLWNMIRYLDPRVTGDSTAWDSALVAALPKIEAVHSDEDLAIALDGMLATLHDPCTRISLGLPGDKLTVQSLASGVMVIHAGNGDLSGSMGAGLMLEMGIPQTSDIVWDLRSSRMPFGHRPALRDLTLNGIGYAFRQHSGYPPPDGDGQRYYSSSLQIVEPLPAAAPLSVSRGRFIYLINKDSAVPVKAIIDQVNSRSAIFSEDPPQEQQAGFTELVQVLGKVEAEVRVAELYYPDGTTGFAPTRVVLNRGQEAVQATAEAIGATAWPMPGERPQFAPLPSAFRDVSYTAQPYPSREMRILAAFRIWGILHYFHPRVSTLGAQWDDVLIELLPKFSEAKNALEYHLAIAEMAVRTGDPGCLVTSRELGAFFGPAAPPFEVRFLEGQWVITGGLKSGPAQAGDVIVKIDGAPVGERASRLAPYVPAPARFLLHGPADRTLKLTVRGKDLKEREIAVPIGKSNPQVVLAHRTGDPVRLINENIGYADLERVEPSAVDAMFEKLANTRAIIFDLRGYPQDTAMAIAARLGNRHEPVIAALRRNLVGLGVSGSHIGMLQTVLTVPFSPKPRYTGRTVALIDGVSPGGAGEGAMCLKAANATVLIGSAVFPTFSIYSTVFDVPGGARVHFGGESPSWPDGSPLKEGSVQPDIEAVPTIAGLRAGKDEVLDKAVAYLSK